MSGTGEENHKLTETALNTSVITGRHLQYPTRPHGQGRPHCLSISPGCLGLISNQSHFVSHQVTIYHASFLLLRINLLPPSYLPPAQEHSRQRKLNSRPTSKNNLHNILNSIIVSKSKIYKLILYVIMQCNKSLKRVGNFPVYLNINISIIYRTQREYKTNGITLAVTVTITFCLLSPQINGQVCGRTGTGPALRSNMRWKFVKHGTSLLQ